MEQFVFSSGVAIAPLHTPSRDVQKPGFLVQLLGRGGWIKMAGIVTSYFIY